MVQTRRDPEQRPSPEALLEAARREDSRAGRLKIFVGAAPGVGKTYEMLQSAHARKKAGVITKRTGQKALAAMLQAGAIERIGTGLAGRPYRYWRKGR